MVLKRMVQFPEIYFNLSPAGNRQHAVLRFISYTKLLKVEGDIEIPDGFRWCLETYLN